MRSGKVVVLAAVCAVTMAATSGLHAQSPATASRVPESVRTSGGRVSGVPGAIPGVAAYRGIPFAAPPVGELRWKPAQPPAPWNGVRAGDRYGPACIQPHQRERVPDNRAVDLPDSPPISEDCLYLNVWTPTSSEHARLPVMMWIYGGAYLEGAGSSPYNQGDTLAAKGIVVVSFNYRLGSLGFLAHPELTAESPHKASGNYALSDTLATLRWVQQNIRHFGGDPANVTIFGESAGAAMSAALVGSPQAHGLFQRAISESGTWMGLNLAPMRTRASAEQETVKAAAAVGAPTLAALRALPAQAAAAGLPKQGMIIDGWIVPEDLSVTFAHGRQNKVDVLAGSNRDEGSFAAGFGPPMTAQRWKDSAPQRWGSLAELGMKAYPAADDAQAASASIRIFADNMQWIMRLFGVSQRAAGKHAYVYHFVHEPPYASGARHLGVCHTCELPYVFDHLEAPRLYPDSSSPEMAVASAPDRELARIMSSYWINFARTGDPNGSGLPRWPQIEGTAGGPVLEIGDNSATGDSLGGEAANLYQALYERQMRELP
jgi:para-nitrobenzyl esterase